MDETLVDQITAIADDYYEQHEIAVNAGDVDMAKAYLHKMITLSRILRLVMGSG